MEAKPPDKEKPPDINKITRTNNRFSENDFGPFKVIVQSSLTNKNIGNYSILSIAKEIFNLNLENIKNIERKGRNRVSVEFKTYRSANDLLDNKKLLEKNFEIFIPGNLVTCKDVVRHVDKNISDEELLLYSSANVKILNAKRLNRKISEFIDNVRTTRYVPTETILFTFSGTMLPRTITIFLMSLKVETYILPVIQCFNCFLYGHTQNQCRGKKRCGRCAQIILDNNNDNSENKQHTCSISTKCLHCGSLEHNSTSNVCIEFDRQKQIRIIMSNENLSFYEANEKIPKKKQINNKFPNRKEFPILTPYNKDEPITVNQRINYTRSKTSYSAAMQSNQENKRKINNQNTGYDKEAHKKALWQPAHWEIPSCSKDLYRVDRERDTNKNIRSGKIILRNKETIYDNDKTYEKKTEMQNCKNLNIKNNDLRGMEVEGEETISPSNWFSYT